jgi:hypothetical protein
MGGMITAGRIASLIEDAPAWALTALPRRGKACVRLPNSKSHSMFTTVYSSRLTPKPHRSLFLGDL